MLKVTLIKPAAQGEEPRAAVELTLEGATMLHEMASKNAAPGTSARVLADLYDAAGTAKELLTPKKGS